MSAVAIEPDSRFDVGVLSLAEAARYLGMRERTLQDWGTSSREPILHVLPQRAGHRTATMTFIATAEAYVLQSFRKAGVNPNRIRNALSALKSEFGNEYVLLAPELATDGVDVLWDFSKKTAGRDMSTPGEN